MRVHSVTRCRGDELPDELSRRESRLQKIREAKAALEQQARDKAAAEAAIRDAEGKPPSRIDPQDAVPDPKAQRNFTDPESKIMKTSSKGWDQCGNAQAVVNENQIIVAADVTDQANDVRQVQPMLDQTIANINQAGVTENIKAFTADAGYFSVANVEVLEEHERVDEAYIVTGRLKHYERVAPAPTGRIPAGLSVKEKDGPQTSNEERGEPNTLAAKQWPNHRSARSNTAAASGSFFSAAWRR